MRERVLGAAFSAFQEFGYAGASTIEITTRAKVSKRVVYRLFGNNRAMLTARIIERGRRMRLPLDLPASRDPPGPGKNADHVRNDDSARGVEARGVEPLLLLR
jgi:AcrR family transcriptional regulator